MAFVKDDYSHTRGVGAVAAMDAGSSARRLAAARAARELARRDALMAASTLGKAALMPTSQATPSFAARSIDVDYFGRGAGGLKQPSGPTGGGRKPLPPKPLPPRRPRLPFVDYRGSRMIKSPGSVIATEPTKGSLTVTEPAPTKAPTKATTTVITGGGGVWTAPGRPPAAVNVGPLEPMPEEPPMPEEAPPPAVAPPKTKSNLLVYAILGAAGLWLLTRK